MIAARVAGVPMPESFIASRSSSSSTSLPAVSIAPEQRRVGVAPRRLGLLLERLGLAGGRLLALLEARELLVGALVLVGGAAVALGQLAVDAAPAGDEQDAAARAEDVLLDRRLDARVLEDRVGLEDGQEAARDEVVDAAVVVAELREVVRQFVGMIAWWSPTFASSTTRASGSRSSDVTYFAPSAYSGPSRPTFAAVGLISGTMSLVR